MPRSLAVPLLALALAAGAAWPQEPEGSGAEPRPLPVAPPKGKQDPKKEGPEQTNPMPVAPPKWKQDPRKEGPEQANPLPVGPLRRDWEAARDLHSAANPAQLRVTHMDLDLKADFQAKVLEGSVVLRLARADANLTTLMLDTRDLDIRAVETSVDGKAWAKAEFKLNPAEPILGAALQITAPKGSDRVRVTYRTSATASGLQWLSPAQTAGKKQPFLFTQSQAIHARSWVPCQDSPAVRATFTARIRTPKGLRAVMGAKNNPAAPKNGDYRFTMDQPIPAYLLALAVGDLDFKALGKRTGVFAEPGVLPKAAKEFADTERMVAAAEKLYGPYAWGRFDLLVLPPSFPFGGMENPRLTFATPTILAGDRSLVSLVAHELAHSWSGNLVTNATWRDLWLNEGFTTYVERRIVEVLYGRETADMEAVLGLNSLLDEMKTLPARDQVLHVDLAGRDPDEGGSGIAYEKGSLFLRTLEEAFGRPALDAWMKGWFQRNRFRPVTTADLEDDLRENLFKAFPEKADTVPLAEWIKAPGLPDGAARATSKAFAEVDRLSAEWLADRLKTEALPAKAWRTQEWLRFLEALPADLAPARMQALDRAFGLTAKGNAEIAHRWLLLAVRTRYEAAYPRLEKYLVAIGRRKLIKPLYEELAKSADGKLMAIDIYRKARSGYHPIAQGTMDALLGWKP